MRRSTCSTCLTKKSCQNVLGWRMVLGWFCCCIVSLLLFKFPYSSQICLGEATGIQGLTLQWSCVATCFRHITSSCGACGVCEVLKLIEIKGKKRRKKSHFFHAEACWCTRQEVGHTWVTPGWPCYALAQGSGTVSLFSRIIRSKVLTLNSHICTYTKMLCKCTEYLRHPGEKICK